MAAQLGAPNRGKGGFTLAEMMIALVVMGILASIVARGVSASGYRADGGARSIWSAMQQAQRTAILRQYDVVVSFDSARGRFRVFEDADNNRVVGPSDLVAWHSLEHGLAFATPPTGIDGAAPTGFAAPGSVVDQMPSIAFHRDGSVSDAMVIYLRDTGSRSKTMRAISVTRSTGRIQWYKGNGSAWTTGGF